MGVGSGLGRSRVRLLAAVAAVICVLALIVYFVGSGSEPPPSAAGSLPAGAQGDPGQAPDKGSDEGSDKGSGKGSGKPDKQKDKAEDKQGEPAGPLEVAFLGDSYVEGEGVGKQLDKRWTTLVSKKYGWRETNHGLGGTGYTTPGPADKATTYVQRVDTVADGAPDVIVVSGGRNDLVSSTPRIRSAAVKLFKALNALKGSPQVVVVAPLWDTGKVPARLVAATKAIEDAAEKTGATFVPVPKQPLAGRRELMSGDGLHPNAAGHRAIAEYLGPALESAVDAG